MLTISFVSTPFSDDESTESPTASPSGFEFEGLGGPDDGMCHLRYHWMLDVKLHYNSITFASH